jgi:hypothetical protein
VMKVPALAVGGSLSRVEKGFLPQEVTNRAIKMIKTTRLTETS